MDWQSSTSVFHHALPLIQTVGLLRCSPVSVSALPKYCMLLAIPYSALPTSNMDICAQPCWAQLHLCNAMGMLSCKVWVAFSSMDIITCAEANVAVSLLSLAAEHLEVLMLALYVPSLKLGVRD